MPTYDYVCDGCGHAFELFQSMTDEVKKTCPECGKKALGTTFRNDSHHHWTHCSRMAPNDKADFCERSEAE